MKKYLLIVFFLSSAFVNLKAQTNFVQNPSFEIYDTCPKLQAEVRCAIGWNIFGQTPDYFNVCSINPEFSVPYNWGGYQKAASGVAYCDFSPYVSHYYHSFNTRDIIGGILSPVLNIGTKYFVSFQVSLSLNNTIGANCATNKLGATFSTVQYNESNPAPITNRPKVYSDSMIKDTAIWTRIFGSFIADSTYSYIIIGNFFDDSHTDTLILDSSQYKNCFANYYVDDVCVSTDSDYAMNYKDTIIFTEVENKSNNLFINLYPNPTHDYFNLEYSDFNEPYELIIYNILGQELYHKGNIQEAETTVNVKEFHDNVLLINIRTKNQTFNYKLLKF